ncbi:MAG: hypothetical protein C5B57_09815 [Blastocatellia bacterium]|nr:MAG: hypothetical protein C5B57_09815 [Blastocatellia bacterium]
MQRFAAARLLAVGLVAIGSPALAQSVDRSAIVGRILDPSGAPVPRAEIEAESPSLIGGPRLAVTNPTGDFRITDLSPGTYSIQTRVPGFKKGSRRDIHLAPDTTLVVDINLELESVSLSVEVSSTATVVDVTSAQAPFRLTAELMANLPTNRVLSEIMNLMPGVNVSIGLGGVQGSNPLFVDGVNVADAQSLAPWASFNYNWVEDVQVVAVGAGAEYGEFNGIIQKSRLKSGANQFRGLTEYRTTRPSWVGNNTSSLTPSLQSIFSAQSQRILEWRDTSVQLGGPVVRDRLWFFSGVQDLRNDTQPALYSGPASIDSEDRRVLAKGDAALAGSLKVNGYYEYDRSHLSGDGLDPFTPIEATTTDTQPDHNWNARAFWMLGDRTTFEVDHTGSTGLASYDPTAPATRFGPYPHYDLDTGFSSGNTWSFFDFGSSRRTIGATMTHYAAGPLARQHALKLGIQHERSRVIFTQGYPGGRSYVDLDGEPYLVYLLDTSQRTTDTHRTTAYVQDEWAIGERLTLEPGVRATFNRGVVSQGTVFSTNPISPRIGVAWDVLNNHKMVVRGHYGRYHDAALTAQFGFMDAIQAPPVITALVTGPNQFDEISRSTNKQYGLDPGISQAYFDQWSAGFERELWPSTSIAVQYLRRNYGDQMAFLDLGSIYQPVLQQDPGADNKVGTADDGGVITVFKQTNPGNEFYYFTNPAGVYRHYSSVQFIGRKQYGDAWQVQGSYIWSRTSGNAVNGFRSNSGGPDLGYNGVTADPNRAINADGPMPFDFTHEIKVLGTWRVPIWGGFNLSGVYQYHTGNAWGRTAQFIPNIQFVTFGVRIEPRGTRRTDALNTVDFRLEKTFGLGVGSRLGLFADLFNVNNQGIPNPVDRRPVVELSGPSFGRPATWTSPRTLRVGVRFSF